MKSNKIIQVLGLTSTLVTLGVISAAAVGPVFAATLTNTALNTLQKADRQMPSMMKNIERTVTNTADGVTMTMTSTDAATVTKLQAMKHPEAAKDANVTRTQTNITNGVQITESSTDAATVTKLQEYAKNGKGGMGRGGKHGGMGGMFGENVEHTVTNTANGVTITMTSTDAATVTKLQTMKQPEVARDANVTETQTNITNGIQITKTSTDAATVTKLQEHAKNAKGGMGRGGKHGGMGGMFGKNVERTVTNTADGVTMTMTSTDAGTVTKLQAMKQPEVAKDANVTRTQTNIANGIQITETSTDAATVTKLQERSHHVRNGEKPTSQVNATSQQ